MIGLWRPLLLKDLIDDPQVEQAIDGLCFREEVVPVVIVDPSLEYAEDLTAVPSEYGSTAVPVGGSEVQLEAPDMFARGVRGRNDGTYNATRERASNSSKLFEELVAKREATRRDFHPFVNLVEVLDRNSRIALREIGVGMKTE